MGITNKVNLLACEDRYVYILARKLGKDDIIEESPKTAGKVDWGFIDMFSTMKKAEKCLERCLEVRRILKGKETYGIISLKKGRLELLKSEKI